jgi:hypothetical protein
LFSSLNLKVLLPALFGNPNSEIRNPKFRCGAWH